MQMPFALEIQSSDLVCRFVSGVLLRTCNSIIGFSENIFLGVILMGSYLRQLTVVETAATASDASDEMFDEFLTTERAALRAMRCPTNF